jgi:hypothetical protein
MLPTIEVVEAIISSPAHISQYLSCSMSLSTRSLKDAMATHVCGPGGSGDTAADMHMRDAPSAGVCLLTTTKRMEPKEGT